jgi:photosystem II stability/assembly factor-like uncharacterized protein
MKKSYFLFLSGIIMISVFVIIYFGSNGSIIINVNRADKYSNENTGTLNEENESVASFEIEHRYFSEWNHPYGDGIPAAVQDIIWNQIKSLPTESEVSNNIVSPWVFKGPAGIVRPDSTSIKYSGRVKDLEAPTGNTPLRVGASSGGIWQYNLLFPVCISNGIETPWLGSFATDPDDNNVIFAGTGEPRVQVGRGLWKTTNGGITWIFDSFGGHTPWCFYKIRFDPNNSNKIHAATSDGYLQSTDNGNTWLMKYAGLITDFAINIFNSSSVVYIAEKKPGGVGGILKSTDGGNTFTRLFSLPTFNIARSVIDCGSSPNIVYALLGNATNDSLLGVYRSDNSGANWINITPQNSQVFGKPSFEYMAAISVCPASASTVMIANKSLCRSTNSGQTWVEYCDDGVNNLYRNLHGDHHRLSWKTDGNTVYSANDGGIAVSTDRGLTWTNTINYLPITQIYHFDVGVSNKNVMYAGTQDNGTIKTENLGSGWLFSKGGDGGTNEIDPSNSNKVFITHNGGINDITYGRYKTTNGGITWPEITNNLPTHHEWVTRLTSDQTPPVYLYTNANSYVYKSTNEGSSWSPVNTSAFPTPSIFSLSVSKFVSGYSVIYAGLRDDPESGNHSGKLLRVFDNGTWYERSSGLPLSGAFVRNVAIHPINTNIGYALMNGFSGQKVFKTTNKGANWSNITGDLPNVPVSDLVPHPTDNNKLYLSSEFGCYKTTNAGSSWIRWNYGMPDRLPQSNEQNGGSFVVNDLDVIDSIAQNGKFYILAATYGRGIWMREISSDDPIGIINNSVPSAFGLSQNYPNPFNPSTKIDFSIPKSGVVRIVMYDVLGRLVKILLDEKKSAGNYTVEFNGADFSSGVYFYKFQTESFTDVKKMLLVK